jgi:hypothetical protein
MTHDQSKTGLNLLVTTEGTGVRSERTTTTLIANAVTTES